MRQEVFGTGVGVVVVEVVVLGSGSELFSSDVL